MKVPEAKPAVTAPEAKADASAVEPKPVKHAKHERRPSRRRLSQPRPKPEERAGQGDRPTKK